MSAEGVRPARGWRVMAARLDARSLRERALAFLIVLALVYAGWTWMLLGPLDAQRASLLARMPGLNADISQLNALAVSIASERRADPDAGRRAELAGLRREGARLESLLVDLTERLVPPRRMAAMLESVLTRETDLRLLRLSGLGVERVVVPSAVVNLEAGNTTAGVARAGIRATARAPAAEAVAMETAATALSAPGLYRHGLRVEFGGGYLQTFAYLRALESLHSRFLWEALEFDVEQYPRARVSITVYSLSLDDAWIGI